MKPLPPPGPGTVLRVLATTDLGTAVVPMRASYGETGTVAGLAALLEREQPAIWLDAGDLTVGPAMVLLDERPWGEMAGLPIAATAAGNHDFDDGLDALAAGARGLGYPMLCANVDAGLPPRPGPAQWTSSWPATTSAAGQVRWPARPPARRTCSPPRWWWRTCRRRPGGPSCGGVFPVPPVRPERATPAVAAFDAAASRVLGESPETWITRTGARRYLPDLLARVFRESSGADAAFVPPGHHGAQAPLDGIMAMLPAGPVTELDVIRLFPEDDYGPVVVELRPGELRAVAQWHAAVTDPGNRAADEPWWNWCRMPAAISTAVENPITVAMVPGMVPQVAERLGRELPAEPAPVAARDALVATLG